MTRRPGRPTARRPASDTGDQRPARTSARAGQRARGRAALHPLDRQGTVPADQAADHRAAAGHHRAHDAARAARAAIGPPGGPHPAGRSARGGQRQHDQLLHRQGHRRGDAAYLAPPASRQGRASRRQAGGGAGVEHPSRRGIHRPAGTAGQLAGGGAGGWRDPVLRVRVHARAEAKDRLEHRHRRRGRLLPRAGRLGGRHRPGQPARGRAVRHHLLLDAAALLGAGDEVPGRLCGGERADAAGGGVPGDGDAQDPLVLLRDGRRHARPRPVRGLAVRPGRGRARRLVPGGGAPPPGAGHGRRQAGPDAAVPPVDRLPDHAVRSHRRGLRHPGRPLVASTAQAAPVAGVAARWRAFPAGCPADDARWVMLERMSTDRSHSRRAFIGGAAAAVAVPAAVVAAVKLGDSGAPEHAAAGTKTAAAAGRSRPVAENDLPGERDWAIRKLGAPDEIMGYAARASVLPGEPVPLFVSTTSRRFRVRALRTGWYRGDLARKVWQSAPVRGHRQRPSAMNEATNTVHTDWGPSLTVPTDGWPAGSYLLRLDADSGAKRYIPLTVRSQSTAGKVVVKNCVATWQAYNAWGGYDLYNGPTGAYDDRALAVSLDRPYDQEGAYLFMVYERKLISLAEQLGLPLAYLTSMDIADDARVLDGASALISLGHDEYWSPPERVNVTAARDAGVNLAFLGANAMFRRTRLEPTALGTSRLVVCYRTSYQQDPMYGVDNTLVTSDWREAPHPDPESSVIGTLYEGYPTVADYVVAAPDAWMFKGTGARKGTRFAALVGIEYDRVNPGSPQIGRAH